MNMNFEELVKSRHSVVKFKPEVKMTEEDFKKIFELTKLAPSTFNVQPTNYLVVLDEEKKQKIKELNYEQYKIGVASGVVIVLGDKTSYEARSAEKIYEPMKMLKIIDECDYQTSVEMISNYGDFLKSNEQEQLVELSRNAGIHAMLFMLSAKYYGYDTCPMHVNNIEETKKYFNIPDHLHPIMMMTIGVSEDKTRPRGYRKPIGEFVRFE